MATEIMKIGILSWDAYKRRNLAIARGELKPKASDPKVWMPSIETAAKVLSNEVVSPSTGAGEVDKA